ncbi:MAG: hypothetical protein OXM61_15305 [Candidatus Poribacteria bacterium]|nr:hypothetical protein [Candidatus Poribacteria bacterium]
MKNYKQSAISGQQLVEVTICKINRQSTVVNNQKADPYEQKVSFSNSQLLKADGFRWLTAFPIILFLFFCSCGEEGLIDPHGETKLPPPDTVGVFNAIDFPTDTGSAWTYINVDTDQEFTLRIRGTRDISGTTHRQMTISEISPVEPDEFNLMAVDHLTANAYYFRLDTDFFDGFPFPILATYFTKTPQALVESAFDVFLPLQNPVSHQKHFPPRRLWDFPLEVGKEWVVFEKDIGIPVTATRFVADKDVQITVPAGTYSTYLVYEEVVYGVTDDPSIRVISPPAAYWVAPSVGVVQYRYSQYRATDALNTQTYMLKSVHLPGPHTD